MKQRTKGFLLFGLLPLLAMMTIYTVLVLDHAMRDKPVHVEPTATYFVFTHTVDVAVHGRRLIAATDPTYKGPTVPRDDAVTVITFWSNGGYSLTATRERRTYDKKGRAYLPAVNYKKSWQ